MIMTVIKIVNKGEVVKAILDENKPAKEKAEFLLSLSKEQSDLGNSLEADALLLAGYIYSLLSSPREVVKARFECAGIQVKTTDSQGLASSEVGRSGEREQLTILLGTPGAGLLNTVKQVAKTATETQKLDAIRDSFPDMYKQITVFKDLFGAEAYEKLIEDAFAARLAREMYEASAAQEYFLYEWRNFVLPDDKEKLMQGFSDLVKFDAGLRTTFRYSEQLSNWRKERAIAMDKGKNAVFKYELLDATVENKAREPEKIIIDAECAGVIYSCIMARIYLEGKTRIDPEGVSILLLCYDAPKSVEKVASACKGGKPLGWTSPEVWEVEKRLVLSCRKRAKGKKELLPL